MPPLHVDTSLRKEMDSKCLDTCSKKMLFKISKSLSTDRSYTLMLLKSLKSLASTILALMRTRHWSMICNFHYGKMITKMILVNLLKSRIKLRIYMWYTYHWYTACLDMKLSWFSCICLSGHANELTLQYSKYQHFLSQRKRKATLLSYLWNYLPIYSALHLYLKESEKAGEVDGKDLTCVFKILFDLRSNRKKNIRYKDTGA